MYSSKNIILKEEKAKKKPLKHEFWFKGAMLITAGIAGLTLVALYIASDGEMVEPPVKFEWVKVDPGHGTVAKDGVVKQNQALPTRIEKVQKEIMEEEEHRDNAEAHRRSTKKGLGYAGIVLGSIGLGSTVENTVRRDHPIVRQEMLTDMLEKGEIWPQNPDENPMTETRRLESLIDSFLFDNWDGRKFQLRKSTGYKPRWLDPNKSHDYYEHKWKRLLEGYDLRGEPSIFEEAGNHEVHVTNEFSMSGENYKELLEAFYKARFEMRDPDTGETLITEAQLNKALSLINNLPNDEVTARKSSESPGDFFERTEAFWTPVGTGSGDENIWAIGEETAQFNVLKRVIIAGRAMTLGIEVPEHILTDIAILKQPPSDIPDEVKNLFSNLNDTDPATVEALKDGLEEWDIDGNNDSIYALKHRLAHIFDGSPTANIQQEINDAFPWPTGTGEETFEITSALEGSLSDYANVPSWFNSKNVLASDEVLLVLFMLSIIILVVGLTFVIRSTDFGVFCHQNCNEKCCGMSRSFCSVPMDPCFCFKEGLACNGKQCT